MQFVEISHLSVVDIDKRRTFGKHIHRSIRTDINTRQLAQHISCCTNLVKIGVFYINKHTLLSQLYVLAHGFYLHAFKVYRVLMQHDCSYHTGIV